MGAILDWTMKLWDVQMRLTVSFQIQDKQNIYHITVDYNEPSYLGLLNLIYCF